MPVKDILAARLPFLRRYARALTGSQRSGDAYVRELLEAAISDSSIREELGRGRVELYRAFSRIWASAHVNGPTEADALEGIEAGAQERLGHISPEHRQALLLTTLEDFSVEETAQILDTDAAGVTDLVNQAFAEIEAETATTVMIVEDEPLISMQLEELVTDLGHRVVATARTRSDAVEAFVRTSPALLLVDIQLADSSSGIDTVEDILKLASVPVIFITAYPERLLTGERPEPTYLVTKPFQEETVRATISQALFFGSTAPIA